MEISKPTSLARRDFLKGAAASAAGLAAFGLAGCAPKAEGEASGQASAAPESWDREVDVIVIGSGGSGLSAAIEAAGAGADTLVLEKGGVIGGTTALSAGITQAAGTEYQKKFTEYQDDTPENHFKWYMALGEEWVDEELVKDLAFGCPEVFRWYVEDLGITIGDFSGQSHVPYADEYYAVRIHRPDGEGAGLIAAMKAKAEGNGAVIETNIEATRLITDSDGTVIGVEAETKKGAETIKANRGVVIATSNIDHNTEMARQFCPQQVWAM